MRNREFVICASGSMKLSRACALRKDMNSPALYCSPCERQGLEPLTSEGKSSDPLHLEGRLSTAPRAPSGPLHLGTGWRLDSHLPETSPAAQPGSSCEGPRLPQHACTHVQLAGHAHAELRVPTVQKAGGGEHLESRLLPKSIGICVSSPPPTHTHRPSSPAVEVTTAGADTHPPTHSHWAASFATSASGWGWGIAPPASFLPYPPPPRTGVQLVLPLLRRRARVMVCISPSPVLTLAP